MKKWILLIIMGVFFLTSLFSHPHMLIFSRCELEFENDRLKGFWVELEFDSFFSGELIWGYDEDRNGSFNETETDHLYNGPFLSLEKYNYFTFIRQAGERFSPQNVLHFTPRIEGGDTLFYRFFVPFESPDHSDFYIAVYDYSLFSLIKYSDNFIEIKGTDSQNIQFDLEENPDYPVYYNPTGRANDMTLYDKWAPGLNTFIPTEIHVKF